MASDNATSPPGSFPVIPRRILVVDDEELVRSMLERYLEREGHVVESADNGRAALELFRQRYFDLVLSDVRMPGMDGIKLLKAIKDLNPRVPVVLISGFGDVETVVSALKAGAENFLTKPLKMESLGKVVERSLSLSCLRPAGLPLLPRVRQVTYLSAPSQPELVCELVQQVALSAVAVGYADYDLDNNLKLALVEGVTNAMEHGNLWDPRKDVTVTAEITRDALKVVIADQGPGFDTNKLPDPTSDDQLFCERGRGVFLMKAIMDGVAFNEAGNQLTLVKRKSEPGPTVE